MNPNLLQPGDLDRHLRTMRRTTIAFLFTVPVAIVAMVAIPAQESGASPLVVTLVVASAALWIGFTANRDAQSRIDRIKRVFAAKGDEQELLRDHRLVNLAVLGRLEVMVIAAIFASIWGGSSAAAWGVLALAAIMMGLSWPTAEKSHALLERAREQRGRE
jgi:amino acid permease